MAKINYTVQKYSDENYRENGGTGEAEEKTAFFAEDFRFS